MKNLSLKDDRLIVKFLSKAKVNHLQIFSAADFGPKKNKMTQIFELLRDQESMDADGLKSALYGREANADTNFKRMYYHFREKMINTLFFVDATTPLFSERAKAYYLCARRAFLTRMLSERGARDLAVELAENTLPVSLKYEFTDISVLLSRSLILHFSSIDFNETKFKKYLQILNVHSKLLNDEISISVLNSISQSENNSKKLKNHTRDLDFDANQNIKRVMEVSKGDPSIELIISCSKVILDYYKESRDFTNFNLWSSYFTEKVLSKEFLSVITLENLINSQLQIALITKDKSTTFQLFSKYFFYLNIGNFNWFVNYYYYILIMFHTREYKEGYEKLLFAMEYKTFRNQSPVIKEYYYLLQAFAHFLKSIKVIEHAKELAQFRVTKFLNEVPAFTRDKQGSNIPIILVQILIFLADKKYSKIIDRIESLNLYAYRYLKKDENFRSQCFIRMISEMVRADFRKMGTIFRTEKLFNKLQAVPIETYPNSAETEIIPYEDLWAMILERLD